MGRPAASVPVGQPAPPAQAGAAGRPTRLLHVFSNFVPSGPEMRTVHLMAAFGDDFHHAILSMDGRTQAAERLPPHVQARILAGPPKAGSLATTVRLRRTLREQAPDLLLTYNWGAFDMLLAAGSIRFRSLLHHEDGFNADEAQRFKLRRILARRLALRLAHRVIVPSRRLQGIALARWRLPAERVLLIPNGIRTELFPPADRNPPLRRQLGVPEASPLIGTVGHLRAEKNLDRLFEAFAHLDPDLAAHLLIVGEGPERLALERRAGEAEIGGRARLVGYQEDPAPFYRAMDVFALTSDTEQMPVALLEAMASGLPVVATAVGDVPAMLPPEQAPFVVGARPAQAAELARPLARLLGEPELRRSLGAANRRWVAERYGFELMCRRYRAAYEDALAQGRRP